MNGTGRNGAWCAALVSALAIGAGGCVDNVVASRVAPPPAPLGFELTPLQLQLLAHPPSPQAVTVRSATRADLGVAQSWFGPGELQAILVIVNRRARERGQDTLPHCLPLCGSGAEPAAR